MSNLTSNKPALARAIPGTNCHWCKHAAIGWAQKSLGQMKPSCGSHGFAFRVGVAR